MNIQVLIDSTVRQVTVLIAQLATSGGIRAPLAQVANQVFLELARELEAQGVSRKVSSDMFGMALRAYIRKVRRLTAGQTFAGKTLWQSVLDFIKAEDLTTRKRILERFSHDGELEVSSILKDLTESGMVFSSGSGETSLYRAANEDELSRLVEASRGEGLDELAWVFVFRDGPLALGELAEMLGRSEDETVSVVRRLQDAGRVQQDGDHLKAREFVIPLGSTHGWEAAVFDHIQAMVQTICQRLKEAATDAEPEGVVGGSTYSFDVWPEHPHYEEVRSQLAEQRARLGQLRERVEKHNRVHGCADDFERVVTYVGQCVLVRGTGENDEE